METNIEFSFGDDILQADYNEYGDDEDDDEDVLLEQVVPTVVPSPVLISTPNYKLEYDLEDFRDFSATWKKLVNAMPLKPFDGDRVHLLAINCRVYLCSCPLKHFNDYYARFMSILSDAIRLCKDSDIQRFKYVGFSLFKNRRKIMFDDPPNVANLFIASCDKFFDLADTEYSNRVDGLRKMMESLKLENDALRISSISPAPEFPTSSATLQSSNFNIAPRVSQPLISLICDPSEARPIILNNVSRRVEKDERSSAPVVSLKPCSKCLVYLPKPAYSINQWKKPLSRQCKLCLPIAVDVKSSLHCASLPPFPSTPIISPSSQPSKPIPTSMPKRLSYDNDAISLSVQSESKAEKVNLSKSFSSFSHDHDVVFIDAQFDDGSGSLVLIPGAPVVHIEGC